MTGLQIQSQIKKQLNNDSLFDLMQSAIKEMEAQLKTLCRSDQIAMSEGLERMVMAGGKRLRPSLAWTCHQIGCRNSHSKSLLSDTECKSRPLEIIPLMCMLELMHTASLIHDDVVDDAPTRRGVATIHQTSGRHGAVQSGDFLLGRAMEYLHLYRGTGINEALAEISLQMCLGEFQQMENLFCVEKQTLETYFEQIKRKTAYLLACSCYCGGIAGGLSKEECEALRRYGEQIGIAFQLKDDILDFTGTKSFGKQNGQDLKRGIFTYPVLYSFKNNPNQEMIRLAEKREKTEEELKTLLQYVHDSKGVEHTEFQIRVCSHEAIRALDVISDCPGKQALIKMAQTLVKRTV